MEAVRLDFNLGRQRDRERVCAKGEIGAVVGPRRREWEGRSREWWGAMGRTGGHLQAGPNQSQADGGEPNARNRAVQDGLRDVAESVGPSRGSQK